MVLLAVWFFSQPLFWALIGVAMGPFFFFRGFWILQRKRLILDTPRSTVRGAALGQVEISGRATGPYTLVAPLSMSDCLYFRITVEAKAQRPEKEKMRELCAPLFVDDGTGTMMIYPEGCELQLEAYQGRAENGNSAVRMAGGSSDAEILYERCIKPGDEIFVLGTLQENPWAKRDFMTERSELSRIGPGFVSEAEADLLRHKVYVALDPALPSGAELAEPGTFDLHPPVMLMKGRGPFVISAGSQRDIIQRLQWKSLLYIWGGAAAAVWGLWEIIEKARAAGLLPSGF